MLAPVQLILLLTACGGGGGNKPQSTVTWNPGTYDVTVVPGTSQSSQINSNVGEQVNEASLAIGPEIAGVLQMSLSGNTVLKSGAAVLGVVEVSAPVTILPGSYEGTVSVLSGTQAMQFGLAMWR